MALQHAGSGEVVRLASLDSGGSTALVKTDQFEAIHLVLAAGATLPPHQVAGRITLQCLDGSVRLSLEGKAPVTLAQGDWLFLDRAEQHGVEAIEDARLLLTVLFDSAPANG